MAGKTIGLLGGIGPESTGRFYLDLIKGFEKEYSPKNNTEFPHIVVNSIPAPELIYEGVDQSTLAHYIEGLRMLEKNGCDFIAIVCNTAYVFFDILQSSVSVPIIPLPKEIAEAMRDKNTKTVTRLVTPTGQSNGLYKFEGFAYNDLKAEELSQLEKAIANFNIGKERGRQINIVAAIFKAYAVLSDTVILGCSELALMLRETPAYREKMLDPMQELVRATLKRYVARQEI